VLENNVTGIAYQRKLHGAEGAKTSEIGCRRIAIPITFCDADAGGAVTGRAPPLGSGRAGAALDLP
jgi:hypothetical protein